MFAVESKEVRGAMKITKINTAILAIAMMLLLGLSSTPLQAAQVSNPRGG